MTREKLGYVESVSRQRASNRRSAITRHLVLRMDALEAYGETCRQCGKRVQHDRFMVVPLGGTRWKANWPDPPARGARNKLIWLKARFWPPEFTVVCGPGCRSALAVL